MMKGLGLRTQKISWRRGNCSGQSICRILPETICKSFQISLTKDAAYHALIPKGLLSPRQVQGAITSPATLVSKRATAYTKQQ